MSMKVGAFIDPINKILIEKETGRKYQPILYRFFDGRKIVSRDQESALVRPFRKVIEEGSPVDNITHVLFNDENLHYVLGSFSFTNKRLVFFPGIMKMRIVYSSNKNFKTLPPFFMDHLTLEENFESWHYTDLRKKKNKVKLPTEGTKKIADSLYLWFLWGVRPMQLEPLPLSQVIYVYGPHEKEIHRRTENIVNARAGGTVTVVRSFEKINDPHYWNFQFYVHRERVNEDPSIAKYGILHQVRSDMPHTTIEDRRSVPSDIIPVHIQGFHGTVFIMANKIKSSIADQSIMTPGEWQ